MIHNAARARRLGAALFLTAIGLFGLTVRADAAGVVIAGGDGPGKGKQIVLIAADDEYRSEELIPQLAKILARRHGFTCTVLFAVDEDGKANPARKDNIPGLEALETADLLILFARFRELPDDQMRRILDYLDAGKPMISLRTTTHAFNYTRRKDSPYARYSYNSKDPAGGFGRAVVGETWAGHYGAHNKESTRGLIAPGMEEHPIVRGVADIWGPSDVYGITSLSGDSKPIILGQVLSGMEPTDKPNSSKDLVPVAWIKTYTGPSGKAARIFTTTMGHAGDFKSEGFRRLLVNACYWCLGMEDQIPARSDVAFVGKYDPEPIGVGKHRQGLTPEQLVNGDGD
jgi:Trehalose utilisation